jgi:hypothetical protein
MNHIFKVNAAPVEHGTFACHTAKADDSELYQYTVRTVKYFAFGFTGISPVPAADKVWMIDPDDRPYDQYDGGKMPERLDFQINHCQADQRSYEAGKAPSSMKGGHDGSLVYFFGGYSLRID